MATTTTASKLHQAEAFARDAIRDLGLPTAQHRPFIEATLRELGWSNERSLRIAAAQVAAQIEVNP